MITDVLSRKLPESNFMVGSLKAPDVMLPIFMIGKKYLYARLRTLVHLKLFIPDI
jgi:hypothetical protein